MFGFSLDLMGFGTRRRISDIRLFLWFCFILSGTPWAKGGVLTRHLAWWRTAPIGLACPHGDKEGSPLVLGIGLCLWQSALGFPSLSLIYKSIVFLLFGSIGN